MGHSQYDLVGQGHSAWNAGKRVGVKRPRFVRFGKSGSFSTAKVDHGTERCSTLRLIASYVVATW